MGSTYTLRGIRLAMRAQGYNYDALGYCTGISALKLRNFAVGERQTLPDEDIQKVCQELSVTPAFLCRWHGKAAQKKYRASIGKKQRPELTSKDEAAVVLYLQENHDAMMRLCANWFRSFQRLDKNFSGVYDVDDLMQEARLAVYRAYTSYDPKRYFTPITVFLDRCVQNQLKELFRKYTALRRQGGINILHVDFQPEEIDAPLTEESVVVTARKPVSDTYRSWTEQHVEAKSMMADMMAWAKENLKKDEYAVLCGIKGGLTQVEMAEQMNCSQAQVSKLTKNVRVKLMDWLSTT